MKKQKHIFQDLNKKIKEIRKPCYIEDCNQPSSFNHLLQKRGILNQIEEDGHVYTLNFNTHYTPPVSFKKKGINKNFGYKGFCQKHDNDLFKPIESNEVDYESYNNQLLSSFRAFYNQRNKKEHLLLLYTASKSKDEIKDIIPEPIYSHSVNAFRNTLDEYQNTEKKLFNDYNGDSKSFHFKTIRLPRTEVCISSCFTYETTEELKRLFEIDCNYELTNLFINFFPTEKESILILGVEKDKLHRCQKYIDRLSKENEKVLQLISDIMLTNVEDWVVSPRFYRENIKPKESQIIDTLRRQTTNEREELKINLFTSETYT